MIRPQGGVLSADELASRTVVEVSGRYHSTVLVQQLSLDPVQFHKWNPGFDKALSAGKKYSLRLPKDKLPAFEAAKSQILMESLRLLLQGNLSAK